MAWWDKRKENDQAWKVPADELLDAQLQPRPQESKRQGGLRALASRTTCQGHPQERITYRGIDAGDRGRPWGAGMSTPPLVPLGDVLRQDTQYVHALEPRQYPKLSVKLYGRGVVLDSPVDGGTVKMQKHQFARRGQVILSEIWAKKGAIGIVPPEGDGALCTSHFFLFDIDRDKALPEFIAWLLRDNYFEPQLNAEARGTTGYAGNPPEAVSLAASIPLPTLAEQRRIVAHIEELAKKVKEARGLRNAAQEELSALQVSKRRSIFKALAEQAVPLESVCSAIIDNLHSNPLYVENGTVPCVRSPDVGYGTLDLDNARRTDEAEYVQRTVRGEPKPDDIVLVREGGGTGKCALV